MSGVLRIRYDPFRRWGFAVVAVAVSALIFLTGSGSSRSIRRIVLAAPVLGAGLIFEIFALTEINVTDREITARGPFRRRRTLKWRDVEKVHFDGSTLYIEGAGTTIGVHRQMRGYREFLDLVSERVASQEEPLPATFHARTHVVAFGLLAVASAVAVIIISLDDTLRTPWMFIGFSVVGILGMLLTITHLQIERDKLRLSARIRSRTIARDDVKDIGWRRVVRRHGVDETRLYARLRNGRTLQLGRFEEPVKLHAALSQWLDRESNPTAE
jgi:hypothetical protein